ncbi:unnamed protein product [Kuraishia capsulata CBS 1993]|uniref:Phosphatase n=1 Tax=Kuraishia capsulata CBS 1993 TaxID=1382522 RepID=W6MGI7_9ASCO|nr:uncharacterized protein KUCA_T00000599001 [Kuraishia capsulata CBS 1993]CDK24633.1 unnamed protein product [Kuraishia capsulata CBS 1993]
MTQSSGAPKAILFTDWDGTVTLQDSNDNLTDKLGMGYEKRKVLNDKILDETLSFRDGFTEMLESIHVPFDKCIEHLLKEIELDPGFKKTYEWCNSQGIPVVVVSSGMKPIIQALLTKLVGVEAVENIEIISNSVQVNDDKSWKIVYKDDSSFGHDKSRSIREYLARLPEGSKPDLFYCGDGVSDLSAARETHLLFAKRGRDLVTYCRREGIPFTQFDSFADILDKIQQVVRGEKPITFFAEK